MWLRNGTRVDRILDINPKATLAIAQHNASSPLLRLPLEVKKLIYKYAFGGKIVHIVQNPDEGPAKFKNTICCALISEEEAQENFENESTNKWYAPANEGRHECCRFQKGTTSRDGKERPEVLSLSPLRCCRQIYNEAHHIPYSTNTFSCADPDALRGFVSSIAQSTDCNHLAVRSLSLEMVYRGSDHDDSWLKAVATCAKQLKALQNISINIDWGYHSFCYRNPTELEPDRKRWKKCFFYLLTLKRLPLKTVALIISDQYAEKLSEGAFFPYWTAKYRWTLDQKKKWAHYVKEVLLSTNR